MASFRYTGQFNSYVPKATGQVIAQARNPKKYKVNKWTQLVKADDELFVYYFIHPDDFVRHYNDNASVWEDGQKRPERSGQRVRHKTREGQAIRRDYDFQIGWRTLKRADYNVLLANTRSAENECMIAWTQEAITLVETASNWSGNTTDAVNLAGAAQWDQGTPEDPVIKKTLLELAERITLGTNGVVGDYENPDDVGLILLLSPQAARRMATTPEIHAIYKESTYTEKLVSRAGVNPNAVWGLPEMLYGYKVVVENAVRVSESPQDDDTLASTSGGASAPRRFVKSFDSAVILSQEGVDGEIGAPNYSTVQRYFVEKEIAVEIFDDSKHQYTDGHVVRHGTTHLAAPATGFLVTDILDPI